MASLTTTSTSDAASLVNAFFANQLDAETENRQIEEFRAKGEVVIHSEISFFVYKHDLKQSQISRMAGVNQAYVSKFLRGEFFDLSENGKTLIYKWFLRFSKSPSVYLQAHNIVLTTSSDKLNSNANSQATTVGVSARSLGNIAHSADSKNGILFDTNNSLATGQAYAASFANGNSVTSIFQDTAGPNAKRTRFSFKPEHLVVRFLGGLF